MVESGEILFLAFDGDEREEQDMSSASKTLGKLNVRFAKVGVGVCHCSCDHFAGRVSNRHLRGINDAAPIWTQFLTPIQSHCPLTPELRTQRGRG